MSGENDNYDVYLEIHAGAGGTESQDWADMLRRMYLKWFDKKKFNYEIISEHKGEEAGIKSSTVKVEGAYLYGLMKSESGVHRLVRISPFDSGARRHTSFASVWVYPAIDEEINIKIEEKDLRIDTSIKWCWRSTCKHNRQRSKDYSHTIEDCSAVSKSKITTQK